MQQASVQPLPQPAVERGLTRDAMRQLYRGMARIRHIELRIAERYGEQQMRCPVHLSVGQEAVAVGVCAELAQSDRIVSTHRCHAHYLAKGGDLHAMLAEIYGKAGGCCGGRGGSMHLFDDAAGVLASVPIVGSSIPLGVGAALAFKQRGEDKVCAVFVGDGALEEGVAHESASFAAKHQLPVLFVVENNMYSVYTHLSERQPARPLTNFAQAHGLTAQELDGNDVLGLRAWAEQSVKNARRGQGPSMLVANTYRWLEHCGPNCDDALGYRPSGELRQWQTRCPLLGFRRVLEQRGFWNDKNEERLHSELQSEVDAAFEWAQNSPFPEPTSARRGVYA